MQYLELLSTLWIVIVLSCSALNWILFPHKVTTSWPDRVFHFMVFALLIFFIIADYAQ